MLARVRRKLAARYPTYAEFEPRRRKGRKRVGRERRVRYRPREPRLLTPDAEGRVSAAALNAEFDSFHLEQDANPRWVAKPPVAYLWARTVRCRDCRADIPLLKTGWLCRKGAKRVRLTMTPAEDGGSVALGVEKIGDAGVSAASEEERDERRLGAGTMSRSGATCPVCGSVTTMADLRAAGRAGRLGARLKADAPGERLTVAEFLRRVRRMVVGFVVSRLLDQRDGAAGDLDDPTTYYLLHRNDFGLAPAPAGACILYALSCNLSDADLAGRLDLLARGGRGGDEEEDAGWAADTGEADAGEADAGRGAAAADAGRAGRDVGTAARNGDDAARTAGDAAGGGSVNRARPAGIDSEPPADRRRRRAGRRAALRLRRRVVTVRAQALRTLRDTRTGACHRPTVALHCIAMIKDRIYSWRLSSSLKEALEDAARVENTSVACLLDRIAGEWLARGSADSDDEEVQRRLHEAAAPFIGSIRGGDPNRAQEASRRVRAGLARKHAR